MDNKYNTMTFCRDDYIIPDTSDNPYKKGEVNNYKLFADISAFIRIAIENGYQMKIWDDEYTIVIEFNYKDESLGGVSLQWVGEDEYIEKYATEEDAE